MNNICTYLNIILKKKFKFNESLDVIYNFNFLKTVNFKCFVILPYGYKKRNVLSVTSNKNFHYKTKNISPVYVKELKLNNIKKFKFFFMDLKSFYYLKKNNFLKNFLRKKKKIAIEYGNISNDFCLLKYIYKGRLLSFNFSKNIQLSIGNINMDQKHILSNFNYLNSYVFEFLKKIGFSKNNLINLKLKTTQGKCYKVL
ncbi:hypothetical protein [Candidatus Vidania fulgoroideorum]